MKKILKGFSLKAAAATTLMSGALLSGSVQAETLLRIATTHAPDQYASEVMQQVKKELEGAGVDLKVKLYMASQLGSGEQLMGEAVRGTIDIVHAFVYSHKDPVLEINSLPYLVSSYDEMEKVFSPGSNFYNLFEQRMDNLGLKLLGITGEGFIGVMSSSVPENYRTTGEKGQNIRVWSAQAAKLATKDLGYKTTTIDWGDAFPAIQQGVVDGMIGATPEATYTTFKEAISHYVPYNAFVENTAYYASNKTWQKKLNDEQRKVVKDVFTRASAGFVDWSRKNDAANLEKLQAFGVEVLPLSDAERSAIAQEIRTKTWPKLEQRLGKDILDKIVADL
ncbi:TRAP transporter substrate-binding protein DctP [Marinobacterium arenosum]|uniref:TRAP transporter substrate-binding protein DctP n=1 Tax=Marinobacterium arenosum TaxID=2862496 RepID=UPI001C97A3D3|nr:TRAP transporter substrate-binding protein DctP [Marinobacterium arenosum]MBY4678390.1 TRAP transporter substrate-binding protein DctP [Marinobacterium arenosum]